MVDPIPALLAQQSRSFLRKLREDGEKQVRDLQQQLAWIDRALAEKENDAPRRPITVTPAANGGKTGRHLSMQRRLIKQILVSREPGRVWAPAELKVALNEYGLEPSNEAVRVTLRRMGEAGEVERGANGSGWKLPSARADKQVSGEGYGPVSTSTATDRST